MSKTFTIASADPKGRKAADAEDIAARYFVCKLYDATRDGAGTWQVLEQAHGRHCALWASLRPLSIAQCSVDGSLSGKTAKAREKCIAPR